MRLGKGQIKRSRQDRIWWSQEGKEEEKKRKVRIRRRRVTFVIGRMTANISNSKLKKGRALKANIAISDVGIEILIASYVEDHFSRLRLDI